MCAVHRNQIWLQQWYCAVADIKSLNMDRYTDQCDGFHWFIQPLFYTCSLFKRHQDVWNLTYIETSLIFMDPIRR